MITIIDYGMGNVGSIKNMLKKIGHKSIITSQVSEIKDATKLILPGVGSFDNGIKQSSDLDLISVLNEKTPVMGDMLRDVVNDEK